MSEIDCAGVEMMPIEEQRESEPQPRRRAWSRIKAERDAAQAEVGRLTAAHAEMTEQRNRLARELSEILAEIEWVRGATPLERVRSLRSLVSDQAATIARLQEQAAPWWARALAKIRAKS